MLVCTHVYYLCKPSLFIILGMYTNSWYCTAAEVVYLIWWAELEEPHSTGVYHKCSVCIIDYFVYVAGVSSWGDIIYR